MAEKRRNSGGPIWFPPGPLALEEDSVTSYEEPNPYQYSSEAIVSTPLPTQLTFESTQPGHFAMQPRPLPNSHPGYPTGHSGQELLPPHLSQSQTHGSSTWTLPSDHHGSNFTMAPDLFGADPALTFSFEPHPPVLRSPATVLQQHPPVLWSSAGPTPRIDPTATHCGQVFQTIGNTFGFDASRQPQFETANLVPPERGSAIPRVLQQWVLPKAEKDQACWRCKSNHLKCDPGNPCGECACLNVPCRRGDVYDPSAEMQFLCRLRPGEKFTLLPRLLPDDLQPAEDHLTRTWRRREDECKKMQGRSDMPHDYNILWSVANTKVENIRLNKPLKEWIDLMELPYDKLILIIVWELNDNQHAAALMGIDAVDSLVALLEAASLCESQFGHYKRQKRLVYNSMKLLLQCLDALRLSASNLLVSANNHTHCTQAHRCISPAFHGIATYATRCAKALTKALFSNKRSREGQWPVVYYSLCLQGHVRCALMSLEAHLRQHVEPSTINNTTEAPTGHQAHAPFSAATYLETAVSLFQQISLQNKGELAKKIRNTLGKLEPSKYLEAVGIKSNGGNSSWQEWRKEDDMPEYLRRFSWTISVNSLPTMYHHPSQYHIEMPVDSSFLGSDMTMTPQFPTQGLPVESRIATGNTIADCDSARGGASTINSIFTATTQLGDATSERSWVSRFDAATIRSLGTPSSANQSFVGTSSLRGPPSIMTMDSDHSPFDFAGTAFERGSFPPF